MSARLTYQPALDGVRAVAVTMVVAFHAGAEWMAGGYVGVSVFFTLSGYLITALLLAEHELTGSVRLGDFYSRRMKRLLPASLACLALVMAVAALGGFDGITTLRRDVIAALLQIANWVELAGDSSYAELTNATLGRVGPLEHYWSLAIEEQFYWVWPLVMIAVLRLTPRWRVRVLVALAFVGACAAPLIAEWWGPDAAYWATPARAGEILVGAVVAVALHGRAVTAPSVRWLAPAGLAVIVWAAVSWPAASGPAYEGWLPVFALASAALIVGLQTESPVRRLLSSRPLVWVGGVSYGIYLFHWPVFALVTSSSAGVDGVGLLAARLALTMLLTVVSARVIERPVRRWSPHWNRPLLGGLGASLALGVVAVVTLDAAPGTEAADSTGPTIAPALGTLPPLETTPAPSSPTSSTAQNAIVGDTVSTGAPSAGGNVPASVDLPAALSRPVRVVVVGDSTAERAAAGLAAWAADRPDLIAVEDASEAGCGFLRSGTVPTDGAIDWAGACRRALDEELPGILESTQPDVVLLMVTMRDVEDRQWSADEGILSPFDDRFRDRLAADYRAFADQLASAGVRRIAWLLPPHPIAPFQGEQVKMLDPSRYEVQFDVIREIEGERPELVDVVDLDGWLTDLGRHTDGTLYTDGIHWTDDAAYWVSASFLGPSLVSVALS